ncbi:MAG: hypothetical protein D3923_13205, partial [Candidatus Electrothrix sp. AR3]|nr:hypothetical protein [Candidatus Electrothrix sp. AR3]
MLFLQSFPKKTTVSAIIYLAVHFAIIFLFNAYCLANVDQRNDGTVRTVPTMDLPPLQKSLFWILENRPATKLGFLGLQDNPEQLDIMLIKLYLENGISPYWVTEYGPRPKAFTLLSVLARAEEEGLDPARYRIDDIAKSLHSKETEKLARLDIMLTLAMGLYITDMREGRVVSCLLDPKLFAAARDKEVDILSIIQDGLTAPDLIYFLQMQAPQHADYYSLKKLLAAYRQLEAKGGWPKIPEGPTLKPGMLDERLELMAKRLFISGDLPNLPDPVPTLAPIPPFLSVSMQPQLPPPIYDERLIKAVKRFQYRYNLEQDGAVGK